MFQYINKQIPQLKIILNQGNHDVVYMNKNLQNYGSFVNIFKNSTNITPVTQNRKIQVSNELNIFMIPYTQNVEDIYKFLSEEKNFNYGIYFFHQDIDLLHNSYNLPLSNTGKILDITKLNQILEQQNRNYMLVNGHYHYHGEYKRQKLTVLGSLSQNTYSEKIAKTSELNKFFGWNMITFNNYNDVKIDFIPSEYTITSISYNNIDTFLDEFDKLKDIIIENKEKQYFQIKLESDAYQKQTTIEEKLQELTNFPNVLEQRGVRKLNLNEFFSNNSVNQSYVVNNSQHFDMKDYFTKQIEKNLQGTSLQIRQSDIIKELTIVMS